MDAAALEARTSTLEDWSKAQQAQEAKQQLPAGLAEMRTRVGLLEAQTAGLQVCVWGECGRVGCEECHTI